MFNSSSRSIKTVNGPQKNVKLFLSESILQCVVQNTSHILTLTS